ncbi:MAG: Na+/H+ antiporter NhaA, partial [Chloroflexi bacterium]|nr:Na+/H+ antiporter NhaA [Chloroflexota bacterium]
SPWRDSYVQLWATDITLAAGDFRLSYDLGHWVNDGLMTLFFLWSVWSYGANSTWASSASDEGSRCRSSPRRAACSCRWPSSWPSRRLARRPVVGPW